MAVIFYTKRFRKECPIVEQMVIVNLSCSSSEKNYHFQ